ncbi:MAG: endonuclease V [Planctomycetes bacterium]|jgi:deoxyribonuclease V|nr:endonuclease V [Phycisphaerae bacterium]NBB95499.1 endonuclease V [Planctomycetota bacterium]
MIPHPWDITPSEAVRLQRKLAPMVRIEPVARNIRTIAGVDCAFSRDKKHIFAAAVLVDAESLDIVATVGVKRALSFPYVSGLLSFREAPAAIDAIRALTRKGGRADLLMCDGQGIAHPRGLGLASHVGLWVDMPTIGVAKSRLCGEHTEPATKRGSRRPLTLEGRRIGTVLRTRDGVRPLFISIGHRLTLDDAVTWTLRAGAGVRLPEPTRQADRIVAHLKAGRA